MLHVVEFVASPASATDSNKYFVFQRKIDLSDFARPPKKPPRAGKGTFRQTQGLHPQVERRKLNEKRERKYLNRVSLALERI